MNNKTFLIILLSLLTIGITKTTAATQSMEESSMQSKAPAPIIHLTPQIAKQVISTFPTPLIVDFYAEWCEPCKTMRPEFEKLVDEYKNKYSFASIDIDECKAIAQEYRIFSIPTIAIFSNGKLIEKITGLQTKESLVEKINKALSTPENLSDLDQNTLNEKFIQAVQAMSLPADVQRLLEAGADVDTKSEQGLTALMIAIFIQAPMGADVTEMVQLLLDYGASTEVVNPRDNQKISAGDCVTGLIERNKLIVENLEKIAALLNKEQGCTSKQCTSESCSI